MSKELWGWFSLLAGVISFAPYIISILRHKTKPHVFSWIVWTITTAIPFAAQYYVNAGPGMWATGFTVIADILVVILALKLGEKGITRGDWLSFIIAMTAIPIWYFTHDPLWAVLLTTFIEVVGFYPTFRKTFFKPYEELPFLYIVSTVKWLSSFFALTNYSLTALLTPLSVVVLNIALLSLIYSRRFIMRKSSASK